MASRYTAPRDRSPPRHFDRRPSATYTPSASSYRGTGDLQSSSADRAPPRGPKADFRGGSYQFSPAPRGRGGFPSRVGDTWDRDRDRDRDTRNPPSTYRREDERGDWPRRERDFAPSDRGIGFQRDRGYPARDRSASPDRPRRNSKENIVSTFNRPTDTASSYYGLPARGGSVRGRGRGDWDRSRGRSSFVAERDREFFPRSRSREEWRERDYDRGRPSAPDVDRGDRFERREYDRPDDRDARGREHDVWPRDRSPGRNSTGRPASPGAVSTISQHGERYKPEYEQGRKPSMAGPLSARSEGRREPDSDYFTSRVETPRRDGPQQFPAPSVPQSSSLGLDYGPPVSVPATTPSAQEKPAPPRPQPKVESFASVSNPTPQTTSTPASAAPTSATSVAPTPASAPAPVSAPVPGIQPPSGPKADRIGPPPNAPSTPRAANQQFEPWSKSDSASRPLRPGPILNTVPPPNDQMWKPGDMSVESRIPAAPAVDRPLPANVPSGPRAASSNFRGRLSSNEQAVPNPPPTAPRQPKANALENRPVPNAPTGPRSSTFPGPTTPHNIPPIGPQAGSNRQWVAPDYRPSKPSIMNQLNKPYQPDARERSSLSGPSRPGGVIYQSQQSKPKITQPLTAESASQMLSARAIGLVAETPSGTQTPMDEDMVDSPADVEMSLPASDEEDIEDDDGLDEDYFANSEETHQREMKLLENKKPLPPLHDPTTAALIIRIQLLEQIANGVVPEAYEQLKASMNSAMELDLETSNAPPSPERTPEEGSEPTLEHPKPRGRPLSQAIVNLIPTPPIDELPHLNQAMQVCHVFEDLEDEHERDGARRILCEQFKQDALQEMDDLEELHAFYRSRYPLWRRDVESAEQRMREVHQPSPAPASPAPSATPSLPPGPDRQSGERTRGARNTTDLDMQQAILMSQQSAKEEEERREREAASNALPNYEVEAVVPCMITSSDLDVNRFEDTNKMVDHEFALDVYGFVPPEDDFTEQEQAAFITAYCQSPKKWGKISDAIPGRSYQECIAHYYLTKDRANYKERWRRSQPKRGRRRAANVKPRANNLISDLALNEDGDGTPVAVTDSGRPRRAAAPTFGDAPDSEAASVVPQAKKVKDITRDGDSSQIKPRGRKGTGTGKGRKAKDKSLVEPTNHTLLPAAMPEPSPQKIDRNSIGKEKLGRIPLKAEAFNPKLEPYGMPTLAAQMSLDVNKIGTGDISTSSLGPVAPQVTSYWSVPEQQKFPYLVRYFGRDYAAIAAFLKTKSPIMIKNYYMREVNNGKHELEIYANEADEKRKNGVSMGSPPTPVQPPKRRYEATPSMAAVPRASVNAGDLHLIETESVPPVAKTIIEEFPSNSIQRIAGEVVTKPRLPREMIHHSPTTSHVHPKIEEPIRVDRPSGSQKSSQGPPRGFFQDELTPYHQQPHQKLQASIKEASPHQRPAQILEHRPTDVRPPQPVQHIEMRSGEYGRGREPPVQTQQNTNVGQSVGQYPPLPAAERSAHLLSRTGGHSRHSSLVKGQSSHEQAAADLVSLRNIDPARNISYAVPAAHSPAPGPAQVAVSMPPRTELHTAIRPIPQPAELAKPIPAKRSNVFSLINDEPSEPEPPVKRQSLESVKRNAVNTPPPPPPPQATLSQTAGIQQRYQEDNIRPSQSAYGHTSRMDPIGQEYRHEYNASPAPGLSNDLWIRRFDPRQQAPSSDQRSTQPSPAPGSYSVIPPNTQSNVSASALGRFDAARNLDIRRSVLGTDHVPSPPPQQQQQQQQQQQTTHLHRSSSNSSQHGRSQSMNYQQTVTSGPSSYSHTTSTTAVPNLQQHQHQSQHRPQLSTEQPRPTIQQYMREKNQATYAHRRDNDITQLPPSSQSQMSQPQPQQQQQPQHQQQQQQPQQHQHQQQQQQLKPPSQPPSRLSDRREIFTQMPEARSSQHHIPTLSQSQSQSQQIGMSYSTAPPSRAYTPPNPTAYGSNANIGAHSHSHHNHQHQYPSHQSQYSHNPPQGPAQHHHQSYQGRSAYGAPPPPPQQLQQQQQQQQHQQHQRSVHSLGGGPPSQQSHYHGYNTDERR